MIKALASLAVLLSSVLSQIPGAMADNVPSNVVTDLAPSGKLRAAINFGNSVLALRTLPAASRAACPETSPASLRAGWAFRSNT